MLSQHISPERKLFFSGEKVTFRLDGAPAVAGYAAVRTNIGGAALRHQEVIEHGEAERTPRGSDWRDFTMLPAADSPGSYTLTLPLPEVGYLKPNAVSSRQTAAGCSGRKGRIFKSKSPPPPTFPATASTAPLCVNICRG